MGAIDDLNAAVQQIGTDAQAAVTEIQQLQAAGNQDAAIEKAVTALTGIDSNIKAILPSAPAATTTPPADSSGGAAPATGS